MLAPPDQDPRSDPPAGPLGAEPGDGEERPWARPVARALLAIVLVASFGLRLRNLDHERLTYFDESFHALVAKNLLEHPLKPTLIERPYLEYDYRDWSENHVWLHKPILPLWQIAVSFAVLGVSPLALRLPSLLLATLSVFLTYLIGKRVVGRWAGLVGATALAFNPEMTDQIHGYVYSDHVDVALLFWVELGIYLVLRAAHAGAWRYALLAGAAQGLGLLTKSFPSLVVAGILVALWALPRFAPRRWSGATLTGRHVLAFFLAAAAVAAPWSVYCQLAYPAESAYENGRMFAHLFTEVEGMKAPLDRLLFHNAGHLHHWLYTPSLVAFFVLLPRVLRARDLRLAVPYLWIAGVYGVLLVSVSKPIAGTNLAMPAVFLVLGALVREVWSRRPLALGVWTGVCAMTLVRPPRLPGLFEGYPNVGGFGVALRDHDWILWHLAGAAVIAAPVVFVLARAPERFATRLRTGLLAVSLLGGLVLLAKTVRATYWNVHRNTDWGSMAELGRFAREELPAEAVLFFETAERGTGEHQLTMFHADRTCYEVGRRDLEALAEEAAGNGGVPYVVSYRKLDLPLVFFSAEDERYLHAWRP